MREQDNSPTEQLCKTVFETIRQQILFQTLFRAEFTRNYQGLFKSSSHIFLNHLIAYFPKIYQICKVFPFDKNNMKF